MPSALLESIEEHFTQLSDPRRETKNKKHLFQDIVAIALCGTICGANNWTEVAAYGKAKESWLRTFLTLPAGISSHDTFNDVFMKIDAKQFERCFVSWVASIAPLLPDNVIAVDGKTVRRSYDRGESKGAIHMVSAWSTSHSLVLGQVKTDEKSNEITAIPQLLDLLSIEKSLVTIDAMGCQKKIAECILAKGADYFLAVKENQPSLYGAIEQTFFKRQPPIAAFAGHAQQSNKGHGRVEARDCWVCDAVELIGIDTREWPGLKSIVVIGSERVVEKKISVEYRYYVSSKVETADYFLNASREHWHVENKLHWTLDVSFREDESRLRKGDGAENFSILRRISLNLLKKEKTDVTIQHPTRHFPAHSE